MLYEHRHQLSTGSKVRRSPCLCFLYSKHDSTDDERTSALAAAMPFLVLAVLALTIAPHLSRAGMQNRHAAGQVLLLLLALAASAAAFRGLGVERGHGATDAKWCWLGHDDMAVFAAERATRRRLRGGAGAVIGLEVAWWVW